MNTHDEHRLAMIALIETRDEQRAEIERLKAQTKWQPIETAPKTGRTILLGYYNSHGNWRTLRGQWYSKELIAEEWSEIDDESDPAELEGWYETAVEPDDPPNCWRTEPTHWMPLPLPPEK